jgi:hypothetical protein
MHHEKLDNVDAGATHLIRKIPRSQPPPTTTRPRASTLYLNIETVGYRNAH